jgi:hypothetical protein
MIRRHAGAGAAANRENERMTFRLAQHLDRAKFDLFRCSPDTNIQRGDVAHERHLPTKAGAGGGNIGLLAPVQHVETCVGKAFETGLNPSIHGLSTIMASGMPTPGLRLAAALN